MPKILIYVLMATAIISLVAVFSLAVTGLTVTIHQETMFEETTRQLPELPEWLKKRYDKKSGHFPNTRQATIQL